MDIEDIIIDLDKVCEEASANGGLASIGSRKFLISVDEWKTIKEALLSSKSNG